MRQTIRLDKEELYAQHSAKGRLRQGGGQAVALTRVIILVGVW